MLDATAFGSYKLNDYSSTKFYPSSMNVVVDQIKYLPPSYGPGICDSGAGPSADMSGIPTARISCQGIPFLNRYFVVPSGPIRHAAKVIDINAATSEVQLQYIRQQPYFFCIKHPFVLGVQFQVVDTS